MFPSFLELYSTNAAQIWHESVGSYVINTFIYVRHKSKLIFYIKPSLRGSFWWIFTIFFIFNTLASSVCSQNMVFHNNSFVYCFMCVSSTLVINLSIICANNPLKIWKHVNNTNTNWLKLGKIRCVFLTHPVYTFACWQWTVKYFSLKISVQLCIFP